MDDGRNGHGKGMVELRLGSHNMLNGPFLLPGLALVALTLLAAITLVLLQLHDDADRMRVPGGWLYRHQPNISSPPSSMAFVPDPTSHG